MKTIIAGSRIIEDYELVKVAIESSCFDITEVVSGTARGVDQLGERWAEKNGISIKRFPAEWRKFGKFSGRIRNNKMARYADALIAVWTGMSHGTSHMIKAAFKKNLKVFVLEK